MSSRHDTRHQPLLRCIWTTEVDGDDRVSLVASWALASAPDLIERDTTVPVSISPSQHIDPAMARELTIAATSAMQPGTW